MTKNELLRVGRIPYANLYPIFHQLETRFETPAVTFVRGEPSELNRKLRRDRLDLSPSSSIEYAKNPGRYLLLPGISVSARSRVMSVLLLSNDPPRRLPDGDIGVTGSSDTSVMLLEILLRESLGKRNRLVRTDLPPKEALRRFPAYLAIGDVALRALMSRSARHITDMATWWAEETGRPFVFALWIATVTASERKGELLRGYARTILSAKTAAREWIRYSRRDPEPAWLPPRLRTAYWRALSYDLDDEVEGLLLFYRMAEKIGRIPSAPPLRFLELS